jgi:hypothetical protein
MRSVWKWYPGKEWVHIAHVPMPCSALRVLSAMMMVCALSAKVNLLFARVVPIMFITVLSHALLHLCLAISSNLILRRFSDWTPWMQHSGVSKSKPADCALRFHRFFLAFLASGVSVTG